MSDAARHGLESFLQSAPHTADHRVSVRVQTGLALVNLRCNPSDAELKVAMVYPDQEPGGMGTLLIPNSLCILEDAPHPDAARRFVDWVLQREVERRLAFSRSAQIPVREGVEHPEHVRLPGADFRVMDVDYGAIGRGIEERGEELRQLFVR